MLNSIRTRLTLWYLAVLALIIIAFAAAVYLLVARNLSRTTDENLAEIGRGVEADLRKEEADIVAERLLPSATVEPDDEKNLKKDEADEAPATIETAVVEELDDLRSREYGFHVFDQNGLTVASTMADADLQTGLKAVPADTQFIDMRAGNEVFRVHQKPLTLDGKRFQLFVSRSLREMNEFLGVLRKIIAVAIPAVLLLAGLGGYFLARRSLAPVVSMGERAANIGSRNLNERLPVKNENDELGCLAKVLNELLSRLETSFARQRQFMADASHELRTPLAIVRGESEVAISKENRPAEEYRESLAIVHDESKRLSKIVEDLFILARADSGQLRPNFTTVRLDEIIRECVRAVGSLAETRNVKIVVNLSDEMPVSGDETLLHRLFLNLLDNAIKYNREGGTVSIAVEIGEKNYCVTVSDTGSGIVKEDQAKIFDRFFRSDKARTRDNTNGKNGVGLGLSIAASIAEVHHGSLSLKESDSNGSVFQVVLPR